MLRQPGYAAHGAGTSRKLCNKYTQSLIAQCSQVDFQVLTANGNVNIDTQVVQAPRNSPCHVLTGGYDNRLGISPYRAARLEMTNVNLREAATNLSLAAMTGATMSSNCPDAICDTSPTCTEVWTIEGYAGISTRTTCARLFDIAPSTPLIYPSFSCAIPDQGAHFLTQIHAHHGRGEQHPGST